MAKTGEWLGKAWQISTQGANIGWFLLLGLIYSIIIVIAQQIIMTLLGRPHFEVYGGSFNFWQIYLQTLPKSYLASIVIEGLIGAPLLAGIFVIMLNLLRTGKVDFNMLFAGYSHFVPVMLVGVVVAIFRSVGFTLCIFPGLVVMALYLFPLLLVMDKNMSFWEAMEASRLKVQQDFWGFIVFSLALVGITLLGALICGIGALFTYPLTLCATAIAYRELWPEAAASLPEAEAASPEA